MLNHAEQSKGKLIVLLPPLVALFCVFSGTTSNKVINFFIAFFVRFLHRHFSRKEVTIKSKSGSAKGLLGSLKKADYPEKEKNR